MLAFFIPMSYVGRFAPSPTGELHFGSLVAALASFLDAKSHKGKWLVRIEDLDPPREDPKAASAILKTLEAYGLHWDDEVIFQSQRGEHYQAILDRLIQQRQVFPCACSRKSLAGKLHNGVCNTATAMDRDKAWRLLCPAGTVSFEDSIQGMCHYHLERDIGDFIIRRRDQLWSYQLAVVVDDAWQNVTHIVRGIDLIDSSIRQMLLQQALDLPTPVYSHIPLVVEADGQKLSKQSHAKPISLNKVNKTLWYALLWLGQAPKENMKNASVTELLRWAIEHWCQSPLMGLKDQPAPDSFEGL